MEHNNGYSIYLKYHTLWNEAPICLWSQ